MPKSEAKRRFQRKAISKATFDPREIKVGTSLSLPVYQVAWLNRKAAEYHMGVSTYAASVFQAMMDSEADAQTEKDRLEAEGLAQQEAEAAERAELEEADNA